MYLLDISTSAPSNWIQIITLIIVGLLLFISVWPFWHRP